MKTLNDRMDSLEKKVEILEKQQAETNNRLGNLENWQKEAVKELKELRNQHGETNKRLERLEKQQERMIRQLKYLNNALENIAQSVEDEARDFLTHKLKNEF